MEAFTRNNLDKAVSPYLRQHKDNPVWWQEWSTAVIERARQDNKVILASSGYAACHWCHVMAQEAFSDPKVADYLNQHFVALKIDREQRPDIDAYLMSFITNLTGGGGWPLNVFLTPDLHPIYACTYLPVVSGTQQPGFLEVLERIHSFYQTSGDQITPFSMPSEAGGENPFDEILDGYVQSFDTRYGGFGAQQKFPSFCTLLFLLYYYEAEPSEQLKTMLEHTLDRMRLAGLHDHLQGGFFRYCTDRAWTIPHFEKMLYDQALGLWCYALAYHVFKKEAYRGVAEQLLVCLEQSFKKDGLYVSAHDADTDHQEGETYLWSDRELKEILTPEEYDAFARVYEITAGGNFEGKNHLLKREDESLPVIEAKLLAARNKRPQPFTDEKFLTGWNALVAVGLVHASRYLDNRADCLEKARTVFEAIWARHKKDNAILHSSCGGEVQQDALFLEDCASVLLLLTYLYEETGDYAREMDFMCDGLAIFGQDGQWAESVSDDFPSMPASTFDHPAPSATALAKLALARREVLSQGYSRNGRFKRPIANDFYNIAAMVANGSFHVRESSQKNDWRILPANTIQRRGPKEIDCYHGTCVEVGHP